MAAAGWLCSVAAFSGAALLRPLALLRTALACIASACIARGTIIMAMAIMRPALRAHIDTFEVVASLTWLAIGVFFAVGVHGMRRNDAAGAP